MAILVTFDIKNCLIHLHSINSVGEDCFRVFSPDKYYVCLTEVSTELICHLQERDSLFLQAHTMQVSVAQLINLHSNVKTTSTQNVTKSITCSRNSQDTLQCT